VLDFLLGINLSGGEENQKRIEKYNKNVIDIIMINGEGSQK